MYNCYQFLITQFCARVEFKRAQCHTLSVHNTAFVVGQRNVDVVWSDIVMHSFPDPDSSSLFMRLDNAATFRKQLLVLSN